jgi:DNA sulfur modification protein DndC
VLTPPFLSLSTDTEALALVQRGALVVVNHSGGKDSQAMLIKIRALVPAAQILVVHAHLPEVEWADTEAHARASAEGLAFVVTRSRKTFFEMVEHRGNWPSPQQRQCTSDLKRGPIEREVRRWIKTHDLPGLVLNCMGMRAEESSKRAKLQPFRQRPDKATTSGAIREWWDWLPIHHYQVGEVFGAIEAAGQQPHWAYSKGMSRLSCCFCIMASAHDLRIAAAENPALYARYVETEKRLGKTVFMRGKAPVGLEEVTGTPARIHLPLVAA